MDKATLTESVELSPCVILAQ